MMLSDADIRLALYSEMVSIAPLDWGNLQPASVDLRLSPEFAVLDGPYRQEPPVLDPRRSNDYSFSRLKIAKGAPYELEPGMFALGSTFETVRIGKYHAAQVEGKSSLGRLGLLVHATAGFIDPGFEGQITLELANLTGSSILLWPGMLIAQLCLFQLLSSAQSLYGSSARQSHYAGQRGPTLSRSHENFSMSDVW